MESKKLSSLKKLKEDLRRLLKKYNEIEDFYIFGSYVKGKDKPRDIDVAMITYKKDYKLLSSVLKELKGYSNLHIEMVLISEIFTEPVWKSLLLEGFSVRKNRFLIELMGIKSGVLYKYDLTKLNKSEKTMFNRAYREELKNVSGVPVSRGSVIIPTEHDGEFKDFLSSWTGVKEKRWNILIL